MTDYSELVARLRLDYCSCTDGYKSRGLTDPHCESCQTRDERHDAADALEAQGRRLAEAERKEAGHLNVICTQQRKMMQTEARLAEAQQAAKTWENEAERRSRRYEQCAVKLADAEALLLEIREDAVHWGMPTTRIDAFLTRPPEVKP